MTKLTTASDNVPSMPCYDFTISALDATMNRFLTILDSMRGKKGDSKASLPSIQPANDMTVCIDLYAVSDDDSEDDDAVFATECSEFEESVYTLTKSDSTTRQNCRSVCTKAVRSVSCPTTVPKSILQREKVASRRRRSVSFDSITYEGETHSRDMYNRKAVSVTSASAQYIYQELMKFKLLSMVVHDASVNNMNLHTGRCNKQERATKEKVIYNILAAART